MTTRREIHREKPMPSETRFPLFPFSPCKGERGKGKIAGISREISGKREILNKGKGSQHGTEDA